MKQAVILAGGLGTRIREVTKDQMPKPMLPVNGRPFLEHILLYLRQQGIKRVVLCVGHLSNRIVEYFGDGSKLSLEITYSFEQVPMGTAGALVQAMPLLDDQFVLMNGDTYFPVTLSKLQVFHERVSAKVTIALKRVRDTARYGRVCVDEVGRITAFLEKGTSGEGYINGGVYIIKREVLDSLSKRPLSLEQDVLPHLVGQGLYGKPFRVRFIDIGVPEDYRRAQSYLAHG